MKTKFSSFYPLWESWQAELVPVLIFVTGESAQNGKIKESDAMGLNRDPKKW